MQVPLVFPVIEEVAGLHIPVDDAERVHVAQRREQRAHVPLQLHSIHQTHIFLLQIP